VIELLCRGPTGGGLDSGDMLGNNQTALASYEGQLESVIFAQLHLSTCSVTLLLFRVHSNMM